MPEPDARTIEQKMNAILAKPQTAFPAFTGAQSTAYTSIKAQLGGDPRDPKVFPPMQPTQLDTLERPADIPSSDWNAVVNQLRKELSAKAGVYAFFEKFLNFFDGVFIGNIAYLTGTAMPFVSATGDETAQFVLTFLINKGGEAAATASEVSGAGVVSGVISAAVGYLQSQTEIGQNTINTSFSALAKTLTDNYHKAKTGIQQMEKQILNNWAALEAMIKELNSASIAWPIPDDKLRAVSVRANQINIWQMLLPKVWNIIRSRETDYYDTNNFDAFYAKHPNHYKRAEPAGNRFRVQEWWLGRGTMLINMKMPSDDLGREIFNNLGVPRPDVFEQKNGWTGIHYENYAVNGGCPSGIMAKRRAEQRGLPESSAEEQLDLVRRFREKLKLYPMGRWYVSVYYAIADPVVELYENDPSVKDAIHQYQGEEAWDAIMHLLATGDWPDGTDIDAVISSGLAIMGAVEQAAENAWGPDNVIQQALDQALPFADEYVTATTEASLLEIIATQTPPADEFVPKKF
jgi:hypothetical protein